MKLWLHSLLVLLLALSAWAAEITSFQAETAVRTWLETGGGSEVGLDDAKVAGVTSIQTNGLAMHLVRLEDGGFVLTSADDGIEPIISFSASGKLVQDDSNPLWVLLKGDIAYRTKVAAMEGQARQAKSATTPLRENQEKWARLLGTDAPRERKKTAISDIRVAPLVKSKWGQGDVGGSPCYNYYTPSHHVCGCVATATAQIMRYFQFPTASVKAISRACYVNGKYRSCTMKGGTYAWSSMPLSPNSSITPGQRKAIGKLTYDIGVAVGMSWAKDGSAASIGDAGEQLVEVFGYAGTVYDGWIDSANDVKKVVIPNCNAGLPVIMGIFGKDAGHAVVVDGYGYNSGTFYIHVNLGWGGMDDAWYNPPNINTTHYKFDVIDSFVCNISPTKTADNTIVSGRVVTPSKQPLAGVRVTASRDGVVLGSGKTDAKGLYGFFVSGGECIVSAVFGGASNSTTLAVQACSAYLNNDLHGVDFVVTPPTYQVVFEANGGTGEMDKQGFVYGTAKALRANAFTRKGYRFAGWAKTPTGAVAYKDKQSVKNLTTENKGVVTLYARWSANPYTVAFNANGGTGTMAAQGMTYNKAAALRANAFKRANYLFKGWSRTASGAIAYTNQQTVKNLTATRDGTVTVYAKWARRKFKVAFNANGGTGTMAEESFNAGEAKALTANAFKRKGYAFAGWATSAAGKVAYKNKQSVKDLTKKSGGTVTLYAKWSANPYTVKFNANGGAGTMAAQGMTYNKAAALRANAFKRSGHAFRGWATSAAGDCKYANKASVKNLTATRNKVVTLYALWAKAKYTVKFNANGGTGTMAAQGMAWGTAAALRANGFVREDFEFEGWATSATGEVAYADEQPVKNLTATGAITLYAIWRQAGPPENVEVEGVELPTSWLEAKGLLGEATTASAVASKWTARAANGRSVLECYVAGLDPNDPDSDLVVVLGEDGTSVDWSPKTEDGVARSIVMEGAETLAGPWESPTNATHRFFRVRASLAK